MADYPLPLLNLWAYAIDCSPYHWEFRIFFGGDMLLTYFYAVH